MGYAGIGESLKKELLEEMEEIGKQMKYRMIHEGISLWWALRVPYMELRSTRPTIRKKGEKFVSVLIKYWHYRKNAETFFSDEAEYDIITLEDFASMLQRDSKYKNFVIQEILDELEKKEIRVRRLFPPTPSNKIKEFRPVIEDISAAVIPINPLAHRREKGKEAKEAGLVFRMTSWEAKAALHAYLQMFERKKPKALLIYDEYGTLHYPAMAVARKMGIKIIAVQHGIIHKEHPGYYHIKENIAREGDLTNYVLPDITCVYGEYEKRLLITNGSYPPESVKITGAPRYDAIFQSMKSMDKEKIIERYGIPPGKKYILWTTQTHDRLMSESGENRLNAEAVFSAFSKLQDFHLIIKLHQGEDQSSPLYNEMNEKYGNVASILDSSSNLYELIFIAEAVLLKNSTVGIEAICMEKPILLLNLVKSHSLETYTDYGFNHIIDTEGDIPRLLKEIEKNSAKEDFQRKREHFMKERCANAGRATEAVVDTIMDYLR